jgi:hypothetical protein
MKRQTLISSSGNKYCGYRWARTDHSFVLSAQQFGHKRAQAHGRLPGPHSPTRVCKHADTDPDT